MHILRKASWFLAVPAALLLGATESRAVFMPLSTVQIGTEKMDVPVALGPDGKMYVTNGGKDFIFTASNGAKLTVNATGNPDPFLSYSFSAQNTTGGTLPFTFTFNTPVVGSPPAGTTVTSQLSGSLTAGDADGVTVTPSLFPGGVSEGSINGVSLSALAVGPAQTSPTGVNLYPPSGPAFSASTVSGSTITSLDVTVSFNLTGGGDQFAASGLITTGNAVPEPSSVALMGVGTLFMGYVMRRKLRGATV